MTTNQAGDPTAALGFTILLLAFAAAVLTCAVLWLVMRITRARARPVDEAELLRTSRLDRQDP